MFPFGHSKDIFTTQNPELTFEEKLDIDEFIQDCKLELRHLGYVKASNKRQFYGAYGDLKKEGNWDLLQATLFYLLTHIQN